MAMSCPACKRKIASVKFTAAKAEPTAYGGQPHNGLMYTCPLCEVVLGFQLDPVAIMSTGVDRVVDELMQRLRK